MSIVGKAITVGGGKGKSFPNGREWKEAPVVINKVHYANNLWVAASEIDGLYYSTDGKNWTQSNLTAGKFNSVDYGDNLWVAGGFDGLYYSADGKKWVPSSWRYYPAYNVSYTGPLGKWICSRGEYGVDWLNSDDGKTWRQDVVTGGVTSYWWTSINMLPVGAFDQEIIYYDPETHEYKAATNTPSNPSRIYPADISGSGVTVVGAEDGAYYSEDGGISWTKSNLTVPCNCACPHGSDIMWSLSTEKNGLYYSANGKNWVQSNITSGKFGSVVAGFTSFVAASDEGGLYYTPYNDIHWVQSNLTSGQIKSICQTSVGDDRREIFVAGGSTGLYYSTDGRNWVQGNITTSRAKPSYICKLQDMWAACTPDGLYMSYDGKTWLRTGIVSACYHVIQFHNSFLVAASDKLYSWNYNSRETLPNICRNWSYESFSAPNSYKVLLYAGYNTYSALEDKVVALGDPGTVVQVTTNGYTWTNYSSSNTTGAATPVLQLEHVGYACMNGSAKGTAFSAFFDSGPEDMSDHVGNITDASRLNTSGIRDIATDGVKILAVSANAGGDILELSNGGMGEVKSKVATLGSSDVQAHTIHWADGVWVVGTNVGLYYSFNGSTFTQSNITTGTFEHVHYYNGLWVAGGANIPVHYSTDGITWEAGDFTGLGVIDAADGIWVAGGPNGLYYSVAWEED